MNIRKENAVKLADKFISKFATVIVAVLSCFDRVIFKGHLPFGSDKHLNGFVDGVLKMRRTDFINLLNEQSERLVKLAQDIAQREGRPYRYLTGKCRKQTLIDQMIRDEKLSDGLVAVLCCQETCRTVKLKHARSRPELVFAYRPQRVLYYYRLDPVFGLIYIRLQTWFPYTVQVYVNGHDWLARQMSRRGIGFEQRDNAFTKLDDPQQAQALADTFVNQPWVRTLDRWVNQVNPVRRLPWLRRYRYYWVIEQAEYATDVLFASRNKLAELYTRLLDHAAVNFSAPDILTFLGRKLHGNFQGEVLTDCKRDRAPGARIKHRMKNNWLKMYDKFGQILRIETVINQPREFRVRRRRTRDGRQQMMWCPMNKGVANFYQYRRVSHAANGRYLDALSVVDNPAAAYREVEQLAQPKVVGGRSYAGFNPARRADVQLLRALLDGKYSLKGFRNADVRAQVYGDTKDTALRTRQRNTLGRVFRRLHVRGLLAKIPRTRRWRVTPRGQQLLGTVVQLYYHGLATAA
jgi:hypothetical protein